MGKSGWRNILSKSSGFRSYSFILHCAWTTWRGDSEGNDSLNYTLLGLLEGIVDSSLYYTMLGLGRGSWVVIVASTTLRLDYLGRGIVAFAAVRQRELWFWVFFDWDGKGVEKWSMTPRFCDWLTNVFDISRISVFCYGRLFQGPTFQNALSIPDSAEKRLLYTAAYFFPS